MNIHEGKGCDYVCQYVPKSHELAQMNLYKFLINRSFGV